jgi:hypothetical protein
MDYEVVHHPDGAGTSETPLSSITSNMRIMQMLMIMDYTLLYMLF